MTSLTVARHRGHRGHQAGATPQRAKNLFALGLSPGCTAARPSRHRALDRDEVRRQARRCATPTSPPSAPAATSARRPSCSASSYEVEPAPARARHLPQRQRHAGAGARADRRQRPQRAAAVLRQLPDHARLRAAARARRATSRFGVRTIQAEDEIAAANMALGAAFAGHLGVTAHERPGHGPEGRDDRPARRCSSCRWWSSTSSAPGPSTGHADQDRAVRPADGAVRPPRRVAAAGGRRLRRPADCFDAAIEAARIAVRYRTPVILLTDTFLANSSEPWRIPDVGVAAGDRPRLRRRRRTHGDAFLPYLRDEQLARPWAIPGTPGLRTGSAASRRRTAPATSPTTPANHALMTACAPSGSQRGRGARRSRSTPDEGAELLVLGWGSTYGAIRAAARRVRERGVPVATAHLRHLNPLPAQHRRGAARLRARAGARR